MKKSQRRVFLKVIAVSPLFGCAGADPSAPHDFGGGAGNVGSGSGGAAGSPTVNGGGPSRSGAGNSAAAGGNNQSLGGSSNAGGSPAAGSGQAGAPIAGGASAGAPSAGSSNSNDPAGAIGNVSAYPLGSFSIAGNIYFMGHDAGGLYAMSMQCTHAGCACTMAGEELDCPCHGSRFDHQGKVLKGPATTPLPHYKVSVDAAGNIAVDRFTVVSITTRTPV